jgi:DNA repair exonuclease SbcCD ATPase subunit
MNIKLKTIEWSNMFSYGENNSLDLTTNTVTQVDAPNGTGKTALVLIIQELLFSKNMKSIKKGDIINRYSSTDKWSGTLYFDVDDKEYKIVVNRKGDTSKVGLFENGREISEHKIPDTYKKILFTLLKTTMEVLNQLMYQSSNSQLEFLKATDTNRKKFLVSLFTLERYLQIGEVLKIKTSEIEKSLNMLRGEEKVIQDFLQQPTLSLEKKTRISVPEVSEQLKDEIKDLEKEIANYSELCKSIDKNNLLIQEREGLKFDLTLQNIDEEELKGYQVEWSKYSVNIQVLEQEIAKLKAEAKKFNTATHCATCGQPIDNSHAIKMAEDNKAAIDGNEAQLPNLRELQKSAKDNITKLEATRSAFLKNQQAINRFEQLSALINAGLRTTYPDNNNSKLEVNKKKLELKTQVEAQSDAMKFNSEVDIMNAKVDMLINQKREFLARQELVSSDIIHTQLKLDRLTTLRKAFSPTGIVAFKLENIIKEFENEINEYLIELSDGQFQINFRLEGEKLNIIVFSNGIESPIENASEGEFSRIQTATLLAIRKLLSKMGGVQINFLFLDEVMGVLDKTGKERLIEILQREENTNTFIVAHDFSHPLVPKLNIVKENNIARIV